MEKQKQVHVRMPHEVYKRLKVKCVYENTSITDYILNLILSSLSQLTEKNSVLIVDDDTIVRESLRDWFKDTYDVTTAPTGKEALELLHKQNFDVLIVDVRLPEKDGVQVLREAKEIKPQIQSIIMTAYPTVDLAVEAMKLGAVDYLIKPIDPYKLEQLIWRTIARTKSGNR
ncbi:MAG: response regulator [Dehalococcoidales bacterium]|nr:response regulator [Dehalococcoidales bacterium]